MSTILQRADSNVFKGPNDNLTMYVYLALRARIAVGFWIKTE